MRCGFLPWGVIPAPSWSALLGGWWRLNCLSWRFPLINWDLRVVHIYVSVYCFNWTCTQFARVWVLCFIYGLLILHSKLDLLMLPWLRYEWQLYWRFIDNLHISFVRAVCSSFVEIILIYNNIYRIAERRYKPWSPLHMDLWHYAYLPILLSITKLICCKFIYLLSDTGALLA